MTNTTKTKRTASKSAPRSSACSADLVNECLRLFAVRIDGSGRVGFALDGDGGRKLFRHRKDATKWMRELKEHISSPCRVVPVTVSILENP